ncbi:MAG: rRNA maturation RNase YbeY [Rhodanobacteraceae bacterium]
MMMKPATRRKRYCANIAVHYATPRRGLPAAASFRRWVDAALAAAGCNDEVELAIRLVDGAEGRALNRRYRRVDRATNVLAFAAELPAGVSSPLLGDLVLCVPVVAREASRQHKLLKAHCAHLTIHGVLHLLGYDHPNARQAERMEALETRILAGLGLADPYTPRVTAQP